MNWKLGTTALVAALFGSLCCIGPVLLVGVAAGTGSLTRGLQPYRPLFIVVTVIALALGYRQTFWVGHAGGCAKEGCSPSTDKWQRILYGAVVLIVVALIAFPYYGAIFLGRS